jgi:molybdopterin synthase catalytic subunit
MLSLYENGLNTQKIFNEWYEKNNTKNYGAFISFVGIVRSEDNIEALSFDIYDVILQKWFNEWKNKLKKEKVMVCMAHSIGDVKINESSFCCGIFSKQRKQALKYINLFVEDFKANAPIWKYDVINSKRIYAKKRSHKIDGSGILS